MESLSLKLGREIRLPLGKRPPRGRKRAAFYSSCPSAIQPMRTTNHANGNGNCVFKASCVTDREVERMLESFSDITMSGNVTPKKLASFSSRDVSAYAIPSTAWSDAHDPRCAKTSNRLAWFAGCCRPATLVAHVEAKKALCSRRSPSPAPTTNLRKSRCTTPSQELPARFQVRDLQSPLPAWQQDARSLTPTRRLSLQDGGSLNRSRVSTPLTLPAPLAMVPCFPSGRPSVTASPSPPPPLDQQTTVGDSPIADPSLGSPSPKAQPRVPSFRSPRHHQPRASSRHSVCSLLSDGSGVGDIFGPGKAELELLHTRRNHLRRFAVLMGAAELVDEVDELMGDGENASDLDLTKRESASPIASARKTLQASIPDGQLLSRMDKLQLLSIEHWRQRKQEVVDTEVQSQLGLSAAECRRLRHAFARYDEDASGTLEGSEIMFALTDLGLKPRLRHEKIAIQTLLDEGTELGFQAFVRLVQDCRCRAQESQRLALHHTFKTFDTEGKGLQMEELCIVLKQLGLCPSQVFEKRAVVEALIMKCEINAAGTIGWEEFEPLVQCVREKLSECRREREQEIRHNMQLSANIFLEFRPELLWLYEAYQRFDTDGSNSLDDTELRRLVAELGCELNPDAEENDLDVERYIDVATSRNFGAIGFVQFLKFVKMIRDKQKEQNDKRYRKLFAKYDRDESGELDLEEMGVLFHHLGIEPDNRAEQDEIAKMVEDADSDGSNSLSFGEFAQLCQRVHEKLRAVRMDEERKFAKSTLHFTEVEFQDLRESFAILDKYNDGLVCKEDMRNALRLMCHPLTMEELDPFAEGDSDYIDFQGYLRLMRHLMTGDASKESAELDLFGYLGR